MSAGSFAPAICANWAWPRGCTACDNQDYLPYCNWDGGSGPDPSPGWLYTLPVPVKLPGAGSEKLPDPFLSPFRSTPSGAWQSGVWWPYVRNSSSYLCPVDIQSKDYTAEPQGASGPGRNNKLSSYQMNGASCNFGSTPIITKISDVWSPGCYLLWEMDENQFGPGNPGAFAFNDGGTYPTMPPIGTGGLGVLHCNNGGEVLTVGGAVNFVTLSYFTAQSEYGPSLTWWAPHAANGGF